MTKRSKAGKPLYISFRASEKLKARIRKLAKADGRTVSSWIFKTLWEKAFPNEPIDDA
jgi:predicted DNA-binding protein